MVNFPFLLIITPPPAPHDSR